MHASDARQALVDAKRIVVKVGTAVVARSDGRLALGRMGTLVEQIHALQASGREVLLVSSGSVGLGAERLGFERRPASVVDRQACAAAGQSALMAFYDGLFNQLGGRCAQVLLTEEDFLVRRRHVNLAATLQRLLALGTVPIINENDTISTAEIALHGASVFGDNDRLSALVASGLGADALVLLSDVAGVYSAPPSEPGAVRLTRFDDGMDVKVGTASAMGRGGMGAKIQAAQLGASAGVDVVVASGREPATLSKIFRGEDVGTWFPARASLNGKRRWLAFATAPAGRVIVNDGAQSAMTTRKASLLAIGVTDVVGDFGEGVIVSICDARGDEFARGRCDVSSVDLRRAAGRAEARGGRPVVHRDQVVILEGENP